MQIFLQTNPFQPHLPQYFPGGDATFSTPTNFSPEMVSAAMRVLERIWRPGYKWKRVGVLLLELGPENAVQSAFDSASPEKIEKRRRAMSAIDAVNLAWGRATVHLASAATREPPVWRMRQHNKSPRYTTRWDELPEVAA